MPLCYGEGILNSIIDKLSVKYTFQAINFVDQTIKNNVTYNMMHATYHVMHGTYNVMHATYDVMHATYDVMHDVTYDVTHVTFLIHPFIFIDTKLKERLSKGQQGVNPLDGFCRKHDIAYSQSSDLQDRNKADYELEQRAWERVKSEDAKFGEKAAAWLVTTAMKAKRNLDMGIKQGGRVTKSPPPQTNSFRRGVIKKVAKVLKEIFLKKSALIALKAARVAIKKVGGKNKVRVPRVIPFDHSGRFLPLLPILGALGAVGSLAGGASAIAKTIIDAKNAKKKLEEDHRHDAAIEAIGAKGSGLYLKKNQRGGFGLYLKKQHPKNYQ
ncbi:hypothetical protein NQ315_003233 [Exocentrus adspersus]|uniref:Uncharacterized protein n=1 Tax=Exocentrus adspersus TaxID=1586481 RepID=A0AAV8VNV6_9CUCU|nr:hypothetical protein NQ315_003233 [Exocentrus adspersus]